MTTPTGRSLTVPLRPLTCWALLGLAGVLIGFGFLTWIFPPSRMDVMSRFSLGQFTSVQVLAAPLLAVLVAAKLQPVLAHAKLIGLVALVEYAAALLFGTLSFLVTLTGRFDNLSDEFYLVGGLLQQLGGILGMLVLLGLLALALLWTYRIFLDIGGRLPTLPEINTQ